MNSKHSQPTAVTTPPKTQMDNLQLIRGIGRAIQKRLHRAGISTFAQLAALSPDEVAQLLAGLAGASAQRIAQQDWVGQAREQMRKTKQAEPGNVATTPMGRQHYATFTVELLLDKGNSVRRTRVVYVQNGDEQAWAGWEATHLVNYLAEHAAIHIEQESSAPGEPPIGAVRKAGVNTTQTAAGDGASASHRKTRRSTIVETPPPVQSQAVASPKASNHDWLADLCLDVGSLQLSETAQVRPTGELSPQKRLRAEISFKLTGAPAGQITAVAPYYTAEVLACELPGGRTITLAMERQRLAAHQLAYQAELEFDLPEVGRYQLIGTVLLPDGNVAGVTVGPLLTVLP